jgi:hypothetical protein
MTVADIYDQHRAAFSRVSAYVVLSDHSAFPKAPERFATIAFKYPQDGAGRLYAYVHVLGCPMVRGFAGGCGYDKASAACASASEKMSDELQTLGSAEDHSSYAEFINALGRSNGGFDWQRELENAGFTVLQAV